MIMPKPELDPEAREADADIDSSAQNTLTDAHSEEPIWVEFEPGDPDNPFEWTKTRKWCITIYDLINATRACWITALSAGFGSAWAIGINDMEQDLHNIHELSLLSITLYPWGFGIIPLLTAPLSEVFGRNRLYIATMAIFAILMIPLALTPTITGVLLVRFLAGAAGSTGATVVGGTVSDIWITKERGWPMSCFAFGAFFGQNTFVAFSGVMVQNLNWRWLGWTGLIASGATLLAVCLFLKETRGSYILSKRAERLRKETGNQRYQCKADAQRKSLFVLIRLSLARPLYFLITEPVVISMTLYICFVWATLWSLLESIPLIFEEVYGFDLAQTGYVFWALVIAAVLALTSNIHQEYLYRRYFPVHGPEARLYYCMVGGIVFVFGAIMVAFGQGRTHWIVPCIGFAVIQFAIFHVYLSVFGYLADAYTLYASSALAAQSFARNMVGGSFPLFTEAFQRNLGFQNANLIMACIGAALALIPFALFWKGAKIRAASKQVQALAKMQEEIDARNLLRKTESRPLKSG